MTFGRKKKVPKEFTVVETNSTNIFHSAGITLFTIEEDTFLCFVGRKKKFDSFGGLGGKVFLGKDKSLVDCAIREFKEETLDKIGNIDDIIHESEYSYCWDYLLGSSSGYHRAHYYYVESREVIPQTLIDDLNNELAGKEVNEIDVVCWMSHDELMNQLDVPSQNNYNFRDSNDESNHFKLMKFFDDVKHRRNL